jgi:hypothetical protein
VVGVPISLMAISCVGLMELGLVVPDLSPIKPSGSSWTSTTGLASGSWARSGTIEFTNDERDKQHGADY